MAKAKSSAQNLSTYLQFIPVDRNENVSQAQAENIFPNGQKHLGN